MGWAWKGRPVLPNLPPRVPALSPQIMRLDDPQPDAEDHEQDQQHGKADAARQCLDHSIAAAFVGHHVVQLCAEVVDDDGEERDDDDFCPHGGRSGRVVTMMKQYSAAAISLPAP